MLFPIVQVHHLNTEREYPPNFYIFFFCIIFYCANFYNVVCTLCCCYFLRCVRKRKYFIKSKFYHLLQHISLNFHFLDGTIRCHEKFLILKNFKDVLYFVTLAFFALLFFHCITLFKEIFRNQISFILIKISITKKINLKVKVEYYF